MTEQPTRRWFQFRLRWMFLLMLIVAVALTWYLHGPHAQRQAFVREIERKGGTVQSEQLGPDWLRNIMGDAFMATFFDRYYSVFVPREYGDEDLRQLSYLKDLETLSLEGTQVTDAGMPDLYGLQKLIFLNLASTKVTDKGIDGLRTALPETIVSKD